MASNGVPGGHSNGTNGVHANGTSDAPVAGAPVVASPDAATPVAAPAANDTGDAAPEPLPGEIDIELEMPPKTRRWFFGRAK